MGCSVPTYISVNGTATDNAKAEAVNHRSYFTSVKHF